MGFLANAFSTSKKTDASSTGTSNTTGNNWDQLQPFFEDYLSQYSPSNISSATVPINAYQSSAADAQQQVAPSTGTAMGTANQIAGQGIDPSLIDKFMSPYISGVVNPMQAFFNEQNQAGLSDLHGNQAVRGALGNTTGGDAAYLSAQQLGQAPQIASLLNQGYTNAGQLAGQSVGAQTAAANTAGNIAGVNTAANTAAFGQGQNIWTDQTQNALTPFALNSQGASSIAPFTQAAGSNTATTGSSTQNTTDTPSVGGTVAGLAGTALKLAPFAAMLRFGGPARSSGGKVDEAPMPKLDHNDDFATKIQKAHEIVHHIRTKNTKTMQPRFADGGDVGLGSWGATVTPASSGFDFAGAGDVLQDFGKKTMWGSQQGQAGPEQAAPQQAAPDPNAQGHQDSALQRILSMVRPTTAPTDRGFDDGGLVSEAPPVDWTSPAPAALAAPGWEGEYGLDKSIPAIKEWIGHQMKAAQDYTSPPVPPMSYPGNPGDVAPHHSAMIGHDSLLPEEMNPPPPPTQVADLRYGEAYPPDPSHLGGPAPIHPAQPPPTPSQVPVAERNPTEGGGWWSNFKSAITPSPETADKMDRIGNILTSVGREGDPFKDVANNALKQRSIDTAAGQLALEAAQNPAKIKALEAQSTDAQIAMKQAELANAQKLQRDMLDHYMKLAKQAQGSGSIVGPMRMQVLPNGEMQLVPAGGGQ